MVVETDVLIIGTGIAGMVAALQLAERGIESTLICSGESLACANSYRAQGGIAYKAPEEPIGLLKKDILEAGGGLCSEKAVDQLVNLGPPFIKEILIDMIDVPF